MNADKASLFHPRLPAFIGGHRSKNTNGRRSTSTQRPLT